MDDTVAVYLEDGSTGLPDKGQYGSHATNNTQSGTTFDIANGTTFPIDTPDSGAFIVVATDEKEEHRYRYASWNNTGGDGDDGQLVLATGVSGTAEAGSGSVTLLDTGAFSANTFRGDIIRNITDASWGYIESVDSANQVTTNIMRDSSGNAVPWQAGDTYETNELIQAYDASDTMFVPYIDEIEDTGTDVSPGSVSVSILYDQDRAVVIRVRNVAAATPIQPFVTTSDILSGGMTVSVIRNEDEVYT